VDRLIERPRVVIFEGAMSVVEKRPADRVVCNRTRHREHVLKGLFHELPVGKDSSSHRAQRIVDKLRRTPMAEPPSRRPERRWLIDKECSVQMSGVWTWPVKTDVRIDCARPST